MNTPDIMADSKGEGHHSQNCLLVGLKSLMRECRQGLLWSFSHAKKNRKEKYLTHPEIRKVTAAGTYTES